MMVNLRRPVLKLDNSQSLQLIRQSCLKNIIILIVCLLLMAGPLGADEVDPGHHVGLGLFNIRSQSPGHTLRLSMPPTIPLKLTPGHFQARIGGTWANVWTEESRYFLDYEMLNFDAALGYGVTPRLLISLGYNQRTYFGGSLDSLIQSFHDLLNIDQQGRDEVPRNQTRMVFYDSNQNPIIDSDEISRLKNAGIDLSAAYILHHGTERWPAVAISGTLRYGIDTPEQANDDEPVDFGVSVGLSRRWSDRWHTYFSGEMTYHWATDYLGLAWDDTTFAALLGIEWRYNPSVSILVQYLITEGAFEDLGQLSDPSQELTFGLKWRYLDRGAVEFGVVENLINHDNSADFGFHLMVTHQF